MDNSCFMKFLKTLFILKYKEKVHKIKVQFNKKLKTQHTRNSYC